MRNLRPLVLALALSLLGAASVLPFGPSQINYQGYLTNPGGNPVTGTFSVQFKIYDAPTGGALLWQETHSITTSAKGTFTVVLGATTPLTGLPLGGSSRYLGITVGGDPELSPRTQLVSAPYSIYTQTVHNATGGTINGDAVVTGLLQVNNSGLTGWPAIRGHSAESKPGSSIGVEGLALNSSYRNIGVYGSSADANNTYVSAAIYGSDAAFGGITYAGYFDGWVNVTENFYAAAKFFSIDDPTDPANRTLQHACVESDEYKNVYDGVVTLDNDGRARIPLPEWFEALNRDFRYQLTAIGAPGPNLYVEREINGGEFRIDGGVPNGKVSWQVTGVRKDPYALAHPVEIQRAKPDGQRGKYLHPVEYGIDRALGVDYDMQLYGERVRAASATEK